MFGRRLHEFTPEDLQDKQAMAGLEIGDVFTREDDNKRYQLVYRDAIRNVVRRWTLIDDVVLLIRRKFEHGSKATRRSERT